MTAPPKKPRRPTKQQIAAAIDWAQRNSGANPIASAYWALLSSSELLDIPAIISRTDHNDLVIQALNMSDIWYDMRARIEILAVAAMREQKKRT